MNSCKFCNQELKHIQMHYMNKYGINVFCCNNCHAEYFYFKNGKCASVSLYTTINSKKYRWTVISNNIAQLEYITISNIEENVILKSFSKNNGDSIPELNPINVNSKIKTLLLFL